MKNSVNFHSLGRNLCIRLGFIHAFVLLFSFVLLAQPDISGNWKLNEGKSQLGDGGTRMVSLMMTIKMDGNKISVESHRQGRDGQEMTIKDEYEIGGKTKSSDERRTKEATTSLSDDKSMIIVESLTKFDMNGNSVEIKAKEVYSLSSDGKTLTVKSDRSSPMGDFSTTLVYDKQ